MFLKIFTIFLVFLLLRTLIVKYFDSKKKINSNSKPSKNSVTKKWNAETIDFEEIKETSKK
jgi:regulatory protein YycI of two-component signal transduction system YycFG